MKIFANHAHVIPKAFMAGAEVPDLLRHLDECGIERCVAFAPFDRQCDGNQNTWLKKNLASDRLVGFGTVNFDKPDLAGQVDEIAQLGFKGIKIHPAYQKIKVDGENAFKVYAAAEKHGLFISFHTGVHWHRISDYNQLLYDEAAYNFPNLKFSMEHVGGYSFFKQATAVLINARNTYAGLTSVSDRNANRLWYLSDGDLSDLFWLVGAKRCIFGLDFPYNKAAQTRIDIDRLLQLNLSDGDKEAIFGGVLQGVLFSN
jgi:predicted TIM-barrel fold metal-dependent hydrolase